MHRSTTRTSVALHGYHAPPYLLCVAVPARSCLQHPGLIIVIDAVLIITFREWCFTPTEMHLRGVNMSENLWEHDVRVPYIYSEQNIEGDPSRQGREKGDNGKPIIIEVRECMGFECTDINFFNVFNILTNTTNAGRCLSSYR